MANRLSEQVIAAVNSSYEFVPAGAYYVARMIDKDQPAISYEYAPGRPVYLTVRPHPEKEGFIVSDHGRGADYAGMDVNVLELDADEVTLIGALHRCAQLSVKLSQETPREAAAEEPIAQEAVEAAPAKLDEEQPDEMSHEEVKEIGRKAALAKRELIRKDYRDAEELRTALNEALQLLSVMADSFMYAYENAVLKDMDQFDRQTFLMDDLFIKVVTRGYHTIGG